MIARVGKIFNSFQRRIPVTAACRVRSCQSHGKIFLDIYRHLRLKHPCSNMTEHGKLLKPSDDALHQAAHLAYMKYKKPEFCKVEGCVEKRAVFKDLTRHLCKQHSLTRDQHEGLVYFICCALFTVVLTAHFVMTLHSLQLLILVRLQAITAPQEKTKLATNLHKLERSMILAFDQA